MFSLQLLAPQRSQLVTVREENSKSSDRNASSEGYRRAYKPNMPSLSVFVYWRMDHLERRSLELQPVTDAVAQEFVFDMQLPGPAELEYFR